MKEAEQAHTPEPWKFDKHHWVSDLNGNFILAAIGECSRGEKQANADRIVQCVNACADIPDPAAHMAEQSERIEELEAELDGPRPRRWEDYEKRIAEQDAKIERLTEILHEALGWMNDSHSDNRAAEVVRECIVDRIIDAVDWPKSNPVRKPKGCHD